MKLYLLNLLLPLLLLFNNLSANNPLDSLYTIKAIDRLYPVDPDLALVRLDSLRRRCEIEGYNTVTRQHLNIIQSCAHFNKNEVRLGIHYAAEALKFARKSHDLGIELLSLHMLCNGYDLQKSDEKLSYYAHQLISLAPNSPKSGAWYEAIALYYQANSAINGGNNKEGLRLLQLASNKVKQDQWDSLILGLDVVSKQAEVYCADQQYEKAWTLLSDLLKQLEATRPAVGGMDLTGLRMGQLKCHSRLMDICRRLGKDDEAISHYQQTVDLYAIYPTLPETPFYLSRYLLNTGKYKEVETFLTSLLDRQRITGDTLNEQSSQYTRLLAEAFTRQERFREANAMNQYALLISDTLRLRSDKCAMLELNAIYRSSEHEATIAEQRHIIIYHRFYLGGLFVMVLIMVVVLALFIRNSRRKKKQNPEILVQPKLSSIAELYPQQSGDEKTDAVYATLFQYIVTEKHYLDNTIDVADVARQCHVSKEEVNSVLTLKAGMTLLEFVNNSRVEYAGVLLLDRTNKTIETIAGESGFNTTRTFLRQFKAKYNMSPSEYRHVGWASTGDNDSLPDKSLTKQQ